MCDGQCLIGRGKWILIPVLKRLIDPESSQGKARYYKRCPEHPGQCPGGGDVGEAVYGGGLQELPEHLHPFRPTVYCQAPDTKAEYTLMRSC